MACSFSLTNNKRARSNTAVYQQVVSNSMNGIRYEKFQGREYLIAPVSMLVPGVLNGSKGALYYPKEEVTKNVEAWNNMPLTLGHPMIKGVGVSARKPTVLDQFSLGFVFNATSKKGKLDGEAWFDIKRTMAMEPSIIRSLESGMPVELSTGLFTDNRPVKNESQYNGRRYTAIASNYRPDHLAVLVGGTRGACSIADGCGVLINQSFVTNCGDDKDCECGCTDKPTKESPKKKCKACKMKKKLDVYKS